MRLLNLKYFFVIMLFLLLAIGITVYLSQRSTDFRQRAAGTDWVEVGTHPHAAQEYTAGYKTLNKLQPWYDVIYSSYGNSHQGPIAFDAFHPDTKTFTHEYIATTEQLDHFKPIFGKLYAPTRNGMHTMEQSAFTALDPKIGWYTVGNVNSSYSRELATLTGTDLWFYYNLHDNGDLARGLEPGAINWPILQRGSTIYAGADTGSIASLNGKLYLHTGSGTTTKVFDGTAWSDKSLKAMFKSVPYKNKLLYLSSSKLEEFDGNTQKSVLADTLKDFYVYSDKVFTLSSTSPKVIKSSSDLSTWTTVSSTVPSTAVSIAVVKGTLYVGTTDSKIYEFSTPVSSLPEVRVAATDDETSETGNNSGIFTISRTGATGSPLTVQFTLTGTATNGVDYQSISTSATIPAGASSLPISITPIPDGTANEGNETMILTLIPSPTYDTGTPSDSLITIYEKPAVYIIETDPLASENGKQATFTVVRKGDKTNPLTVNSGFANKIDLNGRYNWSLATQGTDFTMQPFTIPAGQASVAVPISPIEDSAYEADEYIRIELASSTTYTRDLPSRAVIKIEDNDSPTNPNLVQNPSFENATIAPWGGGTKDTTVAHTGTASLRISGPTADLSLSYSPQTLTLTPGKKYVMSGWIKTNGEVTGRGPTMRYAEITPTLREYYCPWVRDSKGGWQFVSCTFTISSTYTGGRIDLSWVINGPQIAWFDDISIVEAGGGSPNPSPSPSLNPTLTNTPTPLAPTPTKTPTPSPTRTPTQTPVVLGDVNRDGKVDLLDFNVWRDEFLGNATTKQSDLNNDGKVDLLDYNIWLTAYKNT